ncbi:MAG: Uncharacterised protein [SAR116 cluster bacterium]|nr:MAG: Uncharacterised protein [SAR116 cluster bacterium]
MPGMMPPISSLPISSCANVPRSTASADGGISMASPPVPRMGPMDMCFLYPRRDISGTISDPRSAVDPIDDPDRVAKAVPPATVT